MALEDIIKKILRDAKQQADEIKQQAQEEARRILEEARNKADRMREQMLAIAQRHAQQEEDRILTLAKLELRKRVLQEKQTRINEAFERARTRLLNMNKEDYKEFIKRLLTAAVETGDEEVIAPPQYREILTPQFLKEVNRALGKGSGSLRLSPETRNISGGIILRQGRREVNCSLEALFKIAREEMEPEIARILFQE